jgi:predicted secreted protein
MSVPERIRLRVGETKTVRLTSRAGAGYSWTYHISGSPGTVSVTFGSAGGVTRAPDGEVQGGRSVDEQVTIRGETPGRVTLRLEHQRSWQKDKPPLEERVFEVVIEK